MIIHKVRVEDLPGVVSLEAECFSSTEAWSDKAWVEEFENTDRLVLVGKFEGKLVAVAAFRIIDDVVDLHRVLVASAHRGEGFAAALIEPGINWAATHGAKRVMLEVRVNNEAAIRLYHRLGFTKIATRANYYGLGADAYVMVRGVTRK